MYMYIVAMKHLYLRNNWAFVFFIFALNYCQNENSELTRFWFIYVACDYWNYWNMLFDSVWILTLSCCCENVFNIYGYWNENYKTSCLLWWNQWYTCWSETHDLPVLVMIWCTVGVIVIEMKYKLYTLATFDLNETIMTLQRNTL